MSNFQVLRKKMKFTLFIAPFNENSKNINFFQGGTNFGGGTARTLRGNGQ